LNGICYRLRVISADRKRYNCCSIKSLATILKLIQKIFPLDNREFEIIDDLIEVRITKLFRQEKLTVMLSILNPDPVVNERFLEFYSRVKCDPLLSLYIDKPNTGEFNAFIDALQRRAKQAYNRFAGLKSEAPAGVLQGNVYDEPLEFDTHNTALSNSRAVDPTRIQTTIKMLEQYLNPEDIQPLLSVLNELANDPQNKASFDRLITIFGNLGPLQGAVLTYAPYLGLLLSDRPANNRGEMPHSEGN